MSRFPQKGDRYRHQKGHVYKVVGVAEPLTHQLEVLTVIYAIHSEELYVVPIIIDRDRSMHVQGLRPMVVYHADSQSEDTQLWVRDLGMFLDAKYYNDGDVGKVSYRFTKIES